VRLEVPPISPSAGSAAYDSKHLQTSTGLVRNLPLPQVENARAEADPGTGGQGSPASNPDLIRRWQFGGILTSAELWDVVKNSDPERDQWWGPFSYKGAVSRSSRRRRPARLCSSSEARQLALGESFFGYRPPPDVSVRRARVPRHCGPAAPGADPPCPRG
jgi:hypothetical protein